MKYKNAIGVLPQDLIDAIQQYVQGEYIYIPVKDRIESTSLTEYAMELQKRDEHIYTKSLEGITNRTLSKTYSLSESSIRRIIIKQRKRYESMRNCIKEIMCNWDVEFTEIEQIYDTAWRIGEEYILKVYESTDALERNVKISMILEDMNIPVGKIVPTKNNKSYARDDKYFYVLSQRLQGNNIVSIRDTADIGLEMGRIIANLHVTFKVCEKQDSFWENSLLGELKGWIRESLEKDDWKLVHKEPYEDTVQHLERLYDGLQVQLIHRDVHFGNFLFECGKFSGYIDFDLSQRNIRIFDLCYFLLGLLSEEEKADITKEEWMRLVKDVFCGYQERCKLTLQEIEAIPYVMKGIELLFAAWFLGENDAKCAEDAMKIFAFVDENISEIKEAVGTSAQFLHESNIMSDNN